MIQKQIIVNSFHENELAESINLVSRDTTILVDFDETLLLCNSTAEYLNSLRPRLLGALLLRLIAFLRPWQWLVKDPLQKQSRDWFLVFLTTLLMPWNLFFWSLKAKKIAENYSNYELIEQLNKSSSERIIVASLGFKFIIRPILEKIQIRSKNLIGCKFWKGLEDRQKGKLAMVQELVGIEEIFSSMVITDSLDDLPLLTKVAQPFLIVWDNSRYNSPMSDLYFPMMYLHKVKRVGEDYISKAIFLEDLPVLLLAYSWFGDRISIHNIVHGVGICALIFSFWCIYEYGYYENDLVAHKYEKKPTLSSNYHSSQITMNWWQPWIWSLLLGSIGVLSIVFGKSVTDFNSIDINYLTQEIVPEFAVLFCAWNGFLLWSRFCFWGYNYVNKQTRIWLYFVLQICRYCGFIVVTGTNLIGMSFLLSHILSRSVSYTVYRYTGGGKVNWPKLQEKFFRCLLFALFIASLTIIESDMSLLFSWQTAAVSLWCLVRGGKHIKQVISNMGLIQQDKLKSAD